MFYLTSSRYFDSKWNYIDIAGCVLYFIAFGLRIISIRTSESVFIAARFVQYQNNFSKIKIYHILFEESFLPWTCQYGFYAYCIA